MRCLFLAALLAVCGLVQSAPGDLRTTISFRWNPTENPEQEQIERFTLYVATNLPPEPGWRWQRGLTNQQADLLPRAAWWPFWTISNAPPFNLTNATVATSLLPGWPEYPGPYFFTLTCSNWVGESPFSNAVWTPRQPAHRDRGLTISFSD